MDTYLLESYSRAVPEDPWVNPGWFALYTKSRHEKIVSRELEKKHIETFLPIRRIERRWSDRNKIIEEPLFKGYLFVHMPWTARMDVLNTVGAVSFVGKRPDQPAVHVPEIQLENIKRFLNENIQVDPFPYLKEGQRVYVRSGTFKGTEGFVVRKGRHCRLVISLDVLMQSISIEIDQACVEPV